jgi:hypothetical protein
MEVLRLKMKLICGSHMSVGEGARPEFRANLPAWHAVDAVVACRISENCDFE